MPTSRSASAAWPLALAAGTAAAFSPILRNGFVNWDDDRNILRNGWLGRFDPAAIRWDFATPLGGHFQPLSWLSLSLDKALWGLDPAGFHLTSLVLHAAAAVAFFYFLKELLGPSDSDLPAAAAAALFAWHPLRVESVAWATERRDQLCLLFLLLSARSYVRAVVRDPRRPGLDAAFLAFFAASLSKIFAAIFPGLLIALDLGVLRRPVPPRRLVEEKASFLVVAAAVLALGVRAQRLSGSAAGLTAGWADRLAIFAWTPGWSLWKTLVPTGLGPFVYVDCGREPWRFWPIAVLSAALAAGLALARRRPSIFWAGAAWFLALSPALGIFKSGGQFSADRYTLIPDAVLAVAAAFLLKRGGGRARGAALAAAVGLAALSFAQAAVWKDSVALWTRAIGTGGESALVYFNLSNALYEAGRPEEARRYAERLYAERGETPQTLVLMADARHAAGDSAGTLVLLKKAVEAAPGLPEFRMKYGSALYLAGRWDRSAEQYARAAEALPDGAAEKPEAEYSLGVVQLKMGRIEEGKEALSRALALDPTRRDAAELLEQIRAQGRGAPR